MITLAILVYIRHTSRIGYISLRNITLAYITYIDYKNYIGSHTSYTPYVAHMHSINSLHSLYTCARLIALFSHIFNP